MTKNVLFIDRDGTLVEEPADFQIDGIEKIRLVAGVVAAMIRLRDQGYRFVMVTNQDGLGSSSFPTDQFDVCHEFILHLFSSQGIEFDEVFICPHLPNDNCACRKPRTGMLTQYLAANTIRLDKSAVIGDRQTDIQLAEAIGVRGILVNSDDEQSLDWPEIVTKLCAAERSAKLVRNTKETRIAVAVNLDCESPVQISTGIGFFDHMLEQIAKHGGFSLQLRCAGDLQIDEHHTVEDCAIALGNALRQALDNKLGIGRYGFVLPMDESEAQVSIDLSGRAAFRFAAEFPRQQVGEMSTEMVEHFFRTLSDSLGAALHIQIQGENTHHMVEAAFKAVGRSLRQAFAVSGTALPSTKGTLAG